MLRAYAATRLGRTEHALERQLPRASRLLVAERRRTICKVCLPCTRLGRSAMNCVTFAFQLSAWTPLCANKINIQKYWPQGVELFNITTRPTTTFICIDIELQSDKRNQRIDPIYTTASIFVRVTAGLVVILFNV